LLRHSLFAGRPEAFSRVAARRRPREPSVGIFALAARRETKISARIRHFAGQGAAFGRGGAGANAVAMRFWPWY
jgi:hypothetical protein